MLIELWERVRGYSKWPQTQATVKASSLSEERIGQIDHRYSESDPIYEWESSNVLAWRDASGAEHTAEYSVSEDSPLFQLYDGQAVTIRYNPENPAQFYLRGVARSHAATLFNGKVLPFLAGIMSRK